MKKDDAKALDALALAGLPEKALIARLAQKMIGLPADAEWFSAKIRSTYPAKKDIARLTSALMVETFRQEKIHNERKAIKDGLSILARCYVMRVHDRKAEKVRHAKLQFGSYIEAAFAADILSLMELANQEVRSYRVDFLDVAVRPAISALVKITMEGPKIGAYDQTFLFYKEPGTSKARAALTEHSHTVKDAWGFQVPPEALTLRGLGCKFRTDFVTQELVAISPEGDERRFPWRGRPDAGND